MSRWSYWPCVALSCVAVSGCAVDGYTWERAGRVDEMVIKLTEVADVGPICAQYLPGQEVLACAVDRGDYCEIIVPRDSPALVAHEAAHCLGFKHPGGQDVTASIRRRMAISGVLRNASASESTAAPVP